MSNWQLLLAAQQLRQSGVDHFISEVANINFGQQIEVGTPKSAALIIPQVEVAKMFANSGSMAE